MQRSGAGAGLVVVAIAFIAVAVAVIFLFRVQPGVVRPPEACNPSVPLLRGGPGLDLVDVSLEENESAVVALRASSREATLHAIQLSWDRNVTWSWTGERTIPPGDVTGIRVDGPPLRSRTCGLGNLSVTYALPGSGLLNATAEGVEQRVP